MEQDKYVKEYGNDLQITWALTDETLEKIGIGCKFENLTDRNKNQIEDFLTH